MTAITDAHARARQALTRARADVAASIAASGLQFGPPPTAAEPEDDDHPAIMERADGMLERTRGDVWHDIFAGE